MIGRLARAAGAWVRGFLGLSEGAAEPSLVVNAAQREGVEAELRSCNEALAAAVNYADVLRGQIPAADGSAQGIAEAKAAREKLAEAEERISELRQLREALIRRGRKKLKGQ